MSASPQAIAYIADPAKRQRKATSQRYKWMRPDGLAWNQPVPHEAWAQGAAPIGGRATRSERAILEFGDKRKVQVRGMPGTYIFPLSQGDVAHELQMPRSTAADTLKRMAAKYELVPWDVAAVQPHKPADGESVLGRRRGEGSNAKTWYLIPSFASQKAAIEADARIGKRYVNGHLRYFVIGRALRFLSAEELDAWRVDDYFAWQGKMEAETAEQAAREQPAEVPVPPPPPPTPPPPPPLPPSSPPPRVAEPFHFDRELIDLFHSCPGCKLYSQQDIRQLCEAAAAVVSPLSYQDFYSMLEAILRANRQRPVPGTKWLRTALADKARGLKEARAGQRPPPQAVPQTPKQDPIEEACGLWYWVLEDKNPQMGLWAREELRKFSDEIRSRARAIVRGKLGLPAEEDAT